MQEIETKIIDINRNEVEEKLLALGAKKTFEGEISAIFLDFADGSLTDASRMMRLRKENDQAVLTYKVLSRGKYLKQSEELEVKVSDFRIMEQILESLGLRQWKGMRKTRTSYELDGVHFEFDKYLDEHDFIPEFLELESEDEESLYRMVEKIGFTKEDCKSWTAKDLVKHYQE